MVQSPLSGNGLGVTAWSIPPVCTSLLGPTFCNCRSVRPRAGAHRPSTAWPTGCHASHWPGSTNCLVWPQLVKARHMGIARRHRASANTTAIRLVESPTARAACSATRVRFARAPANQLAHHHRLLTIPPRRMRVGVIATVPPP